MGLRLHNTLTRTKQDFVPIDPKNVRMYVCGPTVYDFAHIGNARPLIVFDVLFRLLRHLYGEKHVTYVRNITDVDDKINARAAEEYPDLPLNDAIRQVTEKTAAQFHADVDALGCLRPTHEPRATEYVEREGASTDMIRLIADLIARGHAYAAEGHVLFHVASMPDYGKLSNRSLDDMIAGARVEVAPYKRDPMDFVLWKPSKPGEPAWPSPWSNGRPGWHIECSAMAGALLGDTFDIHGGGIDLIFPHHENEIAQSRCAHGTEVMANYWLHNGFLQVEGEKMSKSLGNFVTIHALLEGWTGRVLRFAMLQTHYRQPINWTMDRLEKSRSELAGWAGLYSGSKGQHDFTMRRLRDEAPEPSHEIVDALADDLNTPLAISVLRERFSGEIHSGLSPQFVRDCEFLGLFDPGRIGTLEDTRASGSVVPSLLFDSIPIVLRARAGIANNDQVLVDAATAELANLGVKMRLDRESFVWLDPSQASSAIDKAFVNEQIADRKAARAAKDFARADEIRKQLDAMGIALKDTKDPKTGELVTTWEVKR